MNQLNGAGRALNFLFRPAYRAGRSEEQRGSNPFAAPEDAVPHSFVQARGHDLRAGKPRGQRGFHPRLPRFQLGAKSFAPARIMTGLSESVSSRVHARPSNSESLATIIAA
jgi:hypothetical protein